MKTILFTSVFLFGCNDRLLEISPLRDLGVADLATPNDLAADLASPNDLSPANDLTPPADLARCAPGAWHWSNPLPDGNDVNGMWGSADDDVWSVGGGVIRHWNGSAWSVIRDDGDDVSWRSVWTSGSEAWVSGSRDDSALDGGVVANGVVLHWDGALWSSVVDVTNERFTSVRGSAPSDVWTAGQYGTLLHWDGKSWTPLDSGIHNGTNSDGGIDGIRAFWEFSPSDLWIFTDGGYARHWNGSAWTAFPNSEELSVVWGNATDDLWAGSQNLLEHWDGIAWQNARPSFADLPDFSVAALWGSPGSLWVAASTERDTFHWDGQSWSKLSTASTANEIDGLWGMSDSDLWEFGHGGAAIHWDGNQWSSTTSGPTPWALTSVWASGNDDAWAVGSTLEEGTLLHWDGQRWLDATPAGTAESGFMGVWGSAADDVWAVGWDNSTVGDGMVFHYDGNAWSRESTPTLLTLRSVWGSAADDVWAVGSGALHWDGQSWSNVPIPSEGFYVSVWGTSASDVWAAGNMQTAHWDGSTWSTVDGAPTGTLVWGASEHDVWIADQWTQSLSHWNGAGWTEMQTPVQKGASLVGWSRAENDAWLIGNGSARWDGDTWSAVPLGAPYLSGVSGLGCNLWAVGAYGAIVRWQ